ncbi:unnamed protein product [Caenorhabditis angaria]|uniref:DUF38 domain-containing protein n=1 Tax=Caenorhabditis angaria TaxID=860376 RepID=A0A9P1ID67_9PELO|nr:unnamed protein product [Caenorhabditis angaria]
MKISMKLLILSIYLLNFPNPNLCLEEEEHNNLFLGLANQHFQNISNSISDKNLEKWRENIAEDINIEVCNFSTKNFNFKRDTILMAFLEIEKNGTFLDENEDVIVKSAFVNGNILDYYIGNREENKPRLEIQARRNPDKNVQYEAFSIKLFAFGDFCKDFPKLPI